MIIHGLQKMTLLDFPGQVACTVFLGGCEFRCPFCHNADLLDMSAPGIMDDDELLEFLKKRKGLLDGVAFTGGEPLLRKDLPELLVRVRDIGYKIKVDTNGDHPDLLKEIVQAGLADYIAMDVKNSPARYAETIGRETFDTAPVDESIQFLLSGQVRYEFRTTVVKQFHDEASFEAIAQWIDGADRYELQGFVDRDTVPFAGLEACSREEMEHFADIVRPYVKTVELRGV
ncbi:MAG: anaerobic ribonucleoside-triphosphate reductase activating protein [Lachnospiraceae bacterium]|nr:anaerobic ribonucleoside-triphosphate reductase activating protein [Lachnospiraceae bacterium]